VSTIPAGWKDDGAILTAPNGKQVRGGFRQEVLKGWEQDNWPLEDEHAYWPADAGQPGKGNGNGQVFKQCKLCWVSNVGVWHGAIGVDLMNALAAAKEAAPPPADTQLKADVAALVKSLHDMQPVFDDLQAVKSALDQVNKDLGA
jgi:hypothetical protein